MNEDYTYEVDGEPEVHGIDNRVLPKFGLTAEFHGTIEKSIRNPAVFYAMTYKHTGVEDEYGEEIVENDYKTGDWVDVSNDDYWGGESRKKTIYDPRPVGYKVPFCDADGNTPYAWLRLYRREVGRSQSRFRAGGTVVPHDRYARLRFRRAGLYRGQSLQRLVDRNEGQGFGQFGTLSRSLRSVYVHHR